MARGDKGKTLGAAPSRLNYEVGDERLGRQRADGYYIGAGPLGGWPKTGFDPLSPDYYLGFLIGPSGFTPYWP
jgi:hypothetical protein